jgi:hypothetical protein
MGETAAAANNKNVAFRWGRQGAKRRCFDGHPLASNQRGRLRPCLRRGAQVQTGSIARFLETRLPSFVAAPFGLMRGVHGAYDEKVSLLQHRVDGRTFDSVTAVWFSMAELCALFLQ